MVSPTKTEYVGRYSVITISSLRLQCSVFLSGSCSMSWMARPRNLMASRRAPCLAACSPALRSQCMARWRQYMTVEAVGGAVSDCLWPTAPPPCV